MRFVSVIALIYKRKKKGLVSSLKPPRYLIEEPVILGLGIWG